MVSTGQTPTRVLSIAHQLYDRRLLQLSITHTAGKYQQADCLQYLLSADFPGPLIRSIRGRTAVLGMGRI